MKKPKQKKTMKKSKKSAPQGKEDVTGTYVYDKETGRVVKVSNDVPGVSSRGAKSSSGEAPSCGMPGTPCSSCPHAGH